MAPSSRDAAEPPERPIGLPHTNDPSNATAHPSLHAPALDAAFDASCGLQATASNTHRSSTATNTNAELLSTNLRACLALNVVQRTLSAAVLAPLVTYFLWQSPAFATATVCSCLQSVCSFEFAWLAHRIQRRLLGALHLSDVRSETSQEASCRSDESQTMLTHESDEALAMLQSSLSLNDYTPPPAVSESGTPAGAEHRPLLETPPATPQPILRRPVAGSILSASDAELGIDPKKYAISTLANRLPVLRRYQLVREWIVATAVSLVLCFVTSVVFLEAVAAWLPQLRDTEIYRYRIFYAVVTNFIGGLCACFSPNWSYALIVFAENVVFTILTMYSTICPINQFSCAIVLEPAQLLLASTGLLMLLRFSTSSSGPEAFVLFVLDAVGFLYIVGSLSILVAFVDDDKRVLYRKLLIVLLYVTWASDTGAYVTGKLLALCKYPYYHPLAAHLSKNKDYEGTLGAVIWGLAAMYLASHLLDVNGSFGIKTAFTIVGVVIGRFGDLFESLLKRAAGVKDSGSLIPGHGGVLDRIDALMFVTLVFARYYTLVLDYE